jgi:hypothetical protein
MDHLLQDLRYALRSLAKVPVAGATAVLCLALGMGATATMFTVVDHTLLRPLPFGEPDRLVNVWSAHLEQGRQRTVVSYPDFVDWREGLRGVEALAGVHNRSFTLSDTDEPERVPGAAISAGLFSMLGISPALGRDFTAADDSPGAPPVVILSDELWRRRYNGDPAIVGRATTINGRPATFVGVLPPRVKFPFNQTAWVPIAPLMHESPRSQREIQVFGRLRQGTTPPLASWAPTTIWTFPFGNRTAAGELRKSDISKRRNRFAPVKSNMRSSVDCTLNSRGKTSRTGSRPCARRSWRRQRSPSVLARGRSPGTWCGFWIRAFAKMNFRIDRAAGLLADAEAA